MIEDLLRSVDRFETRPHRRRGCLRGAHICQSLMQPAEFDREIEARHQMELELKRGCKMEQVTLEEYWEFRTATAQLEFVVERMRVATGDISSTPWSVAAVAQYCQITGELPPIPGQVPRLA